VYCQAKRRAEGVDAGHWFYDPGQAAQCAYVEQTGGGKWRLYIIFEVHDKPLSKEAFDFDSAAEAKTFVGQYFDKEVVDVTPSQLAVFMGPE
jgi:hypothetical protein